MTDYSTLSAAALLATLNKLRVERNMPPLKQPLAKSSMAERIEALMDEPVEVNEDREEDIPTEQDEADQAEVEREREELEEIEAAPEPEPTRKPRASKKAAPVASTGTFTLADLARSLGITPKLARARMRKAAPSKDRARHEFPESRRAEVTKIISPKGK